MTMTGRCRRHHQNSCEGPTDRGLCVKHAAIWADMQADWRERAQEGTPTRWSTPQVVWLPASGYSTNDTSYDVAEGWYFDHTKCRTTTGPHLTREEAENVLNTHPADCRAKVRQHQNPRVPITHCLQGHEYTPANTVIKADGHRRCRTCQNLQSAKARAKKKAATTTTTKAA